MDAEKFRKINQNGAFQKRHFLLYPAKLFLKIEFLVVSGRFLKNASGKFVESKSDIITGRKSVRSDTAIFQNAGNRRGKTGLAGDQIISDIIFL